MGLATHIVVGPVNHVKTSSVRSRQGMGQTYIDMKYIFVKIKNEAH